MKEVMKRRPVPGSCRPRLKQPVSTAHPAVNVIWQTLSDRRDLTVRGVARKSGVTEESMRKWRRGASARLADVEAVLNAMNLQLVVKSMLTIDKT
jgi:hypothetical protein